MRTRSGPLERIIMQRVHSQCTVTHATHTCPRLLQYPESDAFYSLSHESCTALSVFFSCNKPSNESLCSLTSCVARMQCMRSTVVCTSTRHTETFSPVHKALPLESLTRIRTYRLERSHNPGKPSRYYSYCFCNAQQRGKKGGHSVAMYTVCIHR